MKLRFIILILLALGVKLNARAQNDSITQESIDIHNLESDTIQGRENFFLGIPAAYYTPETRWGFGAAGIYNFFLSEEDSISPSSQIQLAASYTQNKQILIYLPFKIYWKEFSNVLEGEFGYYDYLYPYYGIGAETVESNYEKYHSTYFRFQLDALKRLRKNTYLGFRYWFDNPKIDDFKEGGILELGNISGKFGGAISGFGPQLRLDTRDNVYSTNQGNYVNIIYQGFSEYIGSEFNFSRVRLDARKFVQAKKNLVIAGQIYSDITWGDVPFFQKARLGGPNRLRGYLDGRFINNASITPQLEARFKIWKRFGGVAFAGTGTVFESFDELAESRWRYNYGAGIRFTLEQEKQIKVRIDYALTPEGTNFYLTIGEAF